MKYIFLIAFLVHVPLLLMAQEPVTGSGKMIQKKVSVDMFSELEITFPAHVEVNCQTHPNLEITVDDNMFNQIDIINRGNKLIIRAKGWVVPSENCKIIIGTPFLNKLKTGSYSNYSVFNIETNEFSLDNEVANVHLSGQTGSLKIKNGTGVVDAFAMNADDVEVTTWDWSIVKVNAAQSLNAKTEGDGYIIYKNLPADVETDLEGGGQLIHINDYVDPYLGIETEYINFKVINIGKKKQDLYIIGPPWNAFSYGIILPKGEIKEVRFPVGTRVYDPHNPIPIRLGEVGAHHADQLVKLFGADEWN